MAARMSLRMRGASLASVCLALALDSAEAGSPGVNQFEVKELDLEAGSVEIGVQSDHIPDFPRRKSVEGEDGERAFDENALWRHRQAYDLDFGLTKYVGVGIGMEFEQEPRDDPGSFAEAGQLEDFKFTEVSLEALVVLVPVKENGVGLGVYVDFQNPVADEPRTLYAGPIVNASYGVWSAKANVAFVKFMRGAEPDEKWDLAYYSQVKYDVSETWGLAAEAYGTFDRLGGSGEPSESERLIGDQNQHRIGPVVYYTGKTGPLPKPANAANNNGASPEDDDGEGATYVMSAGVLLGLNENTPDTTIKWGVEVEF